jgi:hypothetical protein
MAIKTAPKHHASHPAAHHVPREPTASQWMQCYEEDCRNQLAYGMLIAVLGVTWFIKEVGWLDTNMPIGPLIIIIMGLLVVYAKIKRDETGKTMR